MKQEIANAAAELREALGEEKVSTDPSTLIAYSRDWSPRPAAETKMPDIVTRPTTTLEVAKIVKIANKYRIPVIPSAGLTGMGGGMVPHYGGIIIDTTALNKIIELDVENRTVTVQTGITIKRLNDELEPHGLWFPHDPESKPTSTVGAAIAVDNDSTFGIKYGKIGDYLLNAVLVTGSGEIIRVGHRKAQCTSTGYKLHQLLIASEGTLGIITEATLRIFPKPRARRIEMIVFPSIKKALDALERILQAGITVESAHINCKRRLHFYTHAYRIKYGREPKIPKWAEALLAISISGDPEVVEFQMNYTLKICREMKGSQVKEREMVEGWWASKHTLTFQPFKQKWPDSQRKKKFGAADLGIPIAKVEEAYKKYLEIAKAYNLEILGMCCYHQRPNRVSPSISFALYVDDSNPQEVENFYKYVKEMSLMAVDLEGTMSTYIGDGDRLPEINKYEHGPALKYMKAIKKVFDPNWIMNPGKKFPKPEE